jgi:hypothetical protein
MAEEQTAILFPLDAPERIVVFELSSGATVRHIFRRPTDEDAREFFRALQLAADKKQAREKADTLKPKRELYARLAVNAEGYPQVRGHSGKLCEYTPAPVKVDGKETRRTWHDLVPMAHRLRAVDQLAFCDLTPMNSIGAREIDPDYETVSLDARGFSSDGRMIQFSGLVHCFEPMTEEDRTKFEYDCGRTTVVGGSRSGMTISVPESNVMLRLYDRKIRAVEGYAVKGQPVTDADEIRHWMDPFHKVSAVVPLVKEWAFDVRLPGESGPSEEELLRKMAEAETKE